MITMVGYVCQRIFANVNSKLSFLIVRFSSDLIAGQGPNQCSVFYLVGATFRCDLAPG